MRPKTQRSRTRKCKKLKRRLRRRRRNKKAHMGERCGPLLRRRRSGIYVNMIFLVCVALDTAPKLTRAAWLEGEVDWKVVGLVWLTKYIK
jgi:hypothetical protein